MSRYFYQLKLIIVILLAGPLCSSCARVFIQEFSRDKDLKLHQSNVLVVADNTLSLNEFVKTFNKNFKNKRAFIDDYTVLVANKLRSDEIFIKVAMDSSTH
jgi:hypothetical protein